MLVSRTSMKAAPATITPMSQGLNFGCQGSGGACAVVAGGFAGTEVSRLVAVSAIDMKSGASFHENLRSHRPGVSREHHKTAKRLFHWMQERAKAKRPRATTCPP